MYSRFCAWTKAGVWEDILTTLMEQDLVNERFATRYKKRALYFRAVVRLAGILVWLL